MSASRLSNFAYTSAYIAGVKRGLRMAGHSPLRRFCVTLIVTAILWGISIAVAIEIVDRFSRLVTGEPVAVVVLSKWQSWWRIHPR